MRRLKMYLKYKINNPKKTLRLKIIKRRWKRKKDDDDASFKRKGIKEYKRAELKSFQLIPKKDTEHVKVEAKNYLSYLLFFILK